MSNQHKSPQPASEQDAPEPERLITPEEEAGMDLAELEDPPQAEGTRDPEDNEKEDQSRWKDRRRNEGAD